MLFMKIFTDGGNLFAEDMEFYYCICKCEPHHLNWVHADFMHQLRSLEAILQVEDAYVR